MTNRTEPASDALAHAFRRLHAETPGFVMPNAWDPGSAILLAEVGFEAIATTSAGIAFSLGRPDHAIPRGATPVTRAEMFERIAQIAAAVDLPVNGDLQDGFGASPDAVAETVHLAIATGLAGGNIEDYANGELYPIDLAVERIAAAREAIDASGSSFVLTARTDGQQLTPPTPLEQSIDRANRYREAGADLLYVPGVNDFHQTERLIEEIDGPLNVVLGLGATTLTVDALRARGVGRISLGGTIARAVLGLVRDAATELRDEGTLRFAARQLPQSDLNTLFAAHEQARAASLA